MPDLSLYTVGADDVVTFSLLPVTQVRGISKLVQTILVDLLSDPSEITGRGAGLVASLTAAVTSDEAGVTLIAASAVDVVKSGILQRQRATVSDLDEQLVDLRLVSVTASVTGWSIVVEVTNAVARSVVVTVPGV
jgi:hypothetical protein